ncbi:polypeptide N-acetylgalactosaminyltransferase 12-like [Coregonus clupeaformis]|uniref:polypeptide N-acetylgalactosaminyltransferase 12-like n=1 Tax=Coregonus clupeaformis TaxID=59861 RepID=UPI001BE09735|nr:polypeptide N-acetylgalactosaminyltransferase 12-like [Coregonus clupeaformis]
MMSGDYEYLVMPYDLANAALAFQKFVNEVFRDMLGHQVVVYIDDILDYSATLEDHITHIRVVLGLLENRLYVKAEKCQFHQVAVSFLGYQVSPQGMKMNERKAEAVPTTIKGLQRFLEFANFYRRFIKYFSSIASPLTSLLKGGPHKLVWSPAADEAFRLLKGRFTSTPLLKHPDPTLPFVVEVDASEVGMGAVLSQWQNLDIRQALEREPAPATCSPEHTYVPTEVRDRLLTWAHTSLRLPWTSMEPPPYAVSCKDLKYDYRSLPSTSVVIAFYNEAWSTLLRTVHSVLETSPNLLLREVVLVDDYSDRAHLKEPLENYISSLKKVRLIRARKREGLVRARLLGASIATGDVLTFLDCHCECHEGWLEPLLHRIKEKPSAVVCPVIDVIDWNTFQYLGNPREPHIGGFDWRLVFTWHPVPEYEQKHRHSPIDVIRSPTMAGGLFAVSKNYFHYLGTYDTGMEVWGGENLEFSFRIWQCGGSLEIHPCSHVGHVFPKKAPYSRGKALANSVRAAEVWMDEYKELYYHRNPHARLEAFGDVTDRRKLRTQLRCKDFKWYLENIYPDIHVPEDRPGMFGMLKNRGMSSYCFDYNPPDDNNLVGHRIILYTCHGMGQNQFFEYSSERSEIRYNTREPAGCAAGDAVSTYLTVHLCKKPRQPVPQDQKFVLREDGTLYHMMTQKCVQAVDKTDNGSPAPALRPCSDHANQKWFFEERGA